MEYKTELWDVWSKEVTNEGIMKLKDLDLIPLNLIISMTNIISLVFLFSIDLN